MASQNANFPQTRWSLIASAKSSDDDARTRALSDLCQDYWYPIYAFVRRRGHSAHDAEDLTQGFFAILLRQDAFSNADASRGKLRSYLLGCLKHFLSDEKNRASALKRGGDQLILSYDSLAAEERYQLEPKDESSPDALFDRRWADAVLTNAQSKLGTEFEAKGKAQEFSVLQQFLDWGTEPGTYADAAAKLSATENKIRVSVFRMRKRLGEIVRESIADTVESDDEVASELAYLFGKVKKLA